MQKKSQKKSQKKLRKKSRAPAGFEPLNSKTMILETGALDLSATQLVE